MLNAEHALNPATQRVLRGLGPSVAPGLGPMARFATDAPAPILVLKTLLVVVPRPSLDDLEPRRPADANAYSVAHLCAFESSLSPGTWIALRSFRAVWRSCAAQDDSRTKVCKTCCPRCGLNTGVFSFRAGGSEARTTPLQVKRVTTTPQGLPATGDSGNECEPQFVCTI